MFGVLAGLGAAAGKGFASYQDALTREEQLARQRDLHAVRMQEAAHEAAARNRAEDTRLALAAAAAPVVPVSGEVYQPTVDDEGNAMPVNPTIGMQRVANGPLMTPEAAAAAAAPLNTMPARARRQGEALSGMGQLAEARKLDDAANLMEKEGHLDFIVENFARMPRPEEIAAGKTTFPLAGVDKFNSVGQSRIPAGAVGRAMLRTLPTGQQVPDFEVVDPATGQPIAPSARQYEEAYGMTRAERRADLRQQYSDKLAGEDKAERREILKLTLDERAQDRKDRTADRAADNKRLDRQLDGQINYWDSMSAAANTRADKTGTGGKSTYARMPEADREIYEAAAATRRDIQKDINIAKRDGNWSPEKNAGQRSLQADFDAAVLTQRTLEKKYGSPATAADPVELRATPEAGAPPAAAAGAPPAASAPASAPRGRASMAVTAAEQARRDAEGGAMRLRTEYGGDLNRARADLTVLDAQAGKAQGEARTILRMDADRLRGAIAAAERTTAAPAATPQSATVPARTPAPGQGQPAPQEPVQRAGAALEAARQAAQAAQAQLARYTPMQGRMDPTGWAAARAAAATAEAARERAEQDYRAVVAAQPSTASRRP